MRPNGPPGSSVAHDARIGPLPRRGSEVVPVVDIEATYNPSGSHVPPVSLAPVVIEPRSGWTCQLGGLRNRRRTRSLPVQGDRIARHLGEGSGAPLAAVGPEPRPIGAYLERNIE